MTLQQLQYVIAIVEHGSISETAKQLYVAQPTLSSAVRTLATAVAAGEVVAAPMPGNILKVNCSQGQAVKAGDILVVLEAMKMENEILAPRDGTVAQVVTTKGAVVDTGAPLVVLA